MPSVEKTRLIVLHLTKYSDRGAIVHAVDANGGRRSYFVHGIGNGRRAAADFHPLNILDAVLSSSPRSTMACLKEWKPVARLDSIRSDIFKSTISMFLSELIFRSLRTEDSDRALFAWLCDSIARLEAREGSVANFHLWFLAGYCSRMGFMPSGRIEPPGIFSAADESLFLSMLNSTLDGALEMEMSASRRQTFSKMMVKYLSHHLGSDINIKSLDVLHTVFA